MTLASVVNYLTLNSNNYDNHSSVFARPMPIGLTPSAQLGILYSVELQKDALHGAIRARLREWREITGHTQEDLARLTGLQRTSIGNIEAGHQNLPLHVLYLLAKAMGLRIEQILPPVDEVVTDSPPPSGFIGDRRDAPAMAADAIAAIRKKQQEESDG